MDLVVAQLLGLTVDSLRRFQLNVQLTLSCLLKQEPVTVSGAGDFIRQRSGHKCLNSDELAILSL